MKNKIRELNKLAERLSNYGETQSDFDNYMEIKNKIETFKKLLDTLIKNGVC